MSEKILALDASTKSTGWSYYEDGQLIEYGCLTASSRDVIERIDKITAQLYNILNQHEIDILILEEVLPEKNKQNKTYKALMWLQAAINFLLHENFPKVKIKYFLPSEWRSICNIVQGRGIEREEVKANDIAFVKKTFGISANDDICDAIGIGWAYTHQTSTYAW